MLAGVNYLGHVAVGLATGRRDDLFLLGTALPDLASMVGVRIARERLGGALGEGVDCHLAADRAFHDHPAFRDGSAALRRDLAAAGFPTGPRRAVGHAGWELLLDGTLVGTEVEAAYRRGLAEGASVTGAVAAADVGRWDRLLGQGPPPALRYDDPGWVADRLVAMLGRRPRLAIADGRRPVLVELLAAHVDRVRDVAPAVLGDVAAAVSR